MKRLFNPDSPIWTFLSQLADIVTVNLLWLVCCIPVITAGASTTAMYRVTLNMVDKSDGSIAKTFFSAFRSNFKQATMIWLILLAAATIVGADLILIRNWGIFSKLVLYVFFIFSGFIVFSILTYVFPLTSYFENTIKNMLKIALLLSVKHLPKTVFMLILNVFPFLLLIFFPVWFIYFGFVWLLIGFAVIAYINSKLLLKIFKALPST